MANWRQVETSYTYVRLVMSVSMFAEFGVVSSPDPTPQEGKRHWMGFLGCVGGLARIISFKSQV